MIKPSHWPTHKAKPLTNSSRYVGIEHLHDVLLGYTCHEEVHWCHGQWAYLDELVCWVACKNHQQSGNWNKLKPRPSMPRSIIPWASCCWSAGSPGNACWHAQHANNTMALFAKPCKCHTHQCPNNCSLLPSANMLVNTFHCKQSLIEKVDHLCWWQATLVGMHAHIPLITKKAYVTIPKKWGWCHH